MLSNIFNKTYCYKNNSNSNPKKKVFHFKGDKYFLIKTSSEKINKIDVLFGFTGYSVDKKHFIKVQIKKFLKRKNDIVNEIAIIKELNNKNCVSCPQLEENGNVKFTKCKKDLFELFDAKSMDFPDDHLIHYYKSEYIENNNSFIIGDLILALIEQKSIGIFHNDIKPENIIVDDNNNLFLVDYDQSFRIDKSIQDFGVLDYVRWTVKQDYINYGVSKKGWVRHFPYLRFNFHIKSLFKLQKFNLLNTSYYKNQQTTNTKNGAYHTITHKDIFVNGVRELLDRQIILDKISFKNDEKVLDIGCNVGLLSHYLFKRGCNVSGYEMDNPIVNAAKIISNIFGFKIHFKTFDLDKNQITQDFDTVFLFSVIHHTKNMEDNCKSIAKVCKRIIIECRLFEWGRKPIIVDNKVKWVETSNWDYKTLDELHIGLEKLFNGFKLKKNHGKCDKSRFLIELIRD